MWWWSKALKLSSFSYFFIQPQAGKQKYCKNIGTLSLVRWLGIDPAKLTRPIDPNPPWTFRYYRFEKFRFGSNSDRLLWPVFVFGLGFGSASGNTGSDRVWSGQIELTNITCDFIVHFFVLKENSDQVRILQNGANPNSSRIRVCLIWIGSNSGWPNMTHLTGLVGYVEGKL